MAIAYPWALACGVATLLLVLGATSGLVNTRFWVSEPLACAVFGVLVGPHLLGLLVLDPAHDPHARAILREAARLTLAVAVLAAAMRLPQGWLLRQWRGLAVALGPGMVLMWAAGAGVVALSFGLPLLPCLLLGAVIAPTDPVLSAPVVTGALAREAIPPDLRHALTAESAVNDGLAAPFVMLPILLIGTTPAPWRTWLLGSVLWEVGSAVVLGAAIGYAASLLIRWATRQVGAERSSLLTIALALALTTLAGAQAIGGNGVLAAFVAGTMLNNAVDEDHQERQEHFNEAITRFFDLPIMVLLGAAAPWHAWAGLGWGAATFVAGVLLLRRIPAWLLLRRFMPWARTWSENLFAGWFGPIGAAALFYALEAQDLTGMGLLWPIVSLAAFASVVAHGVTGTHLSAFLGRRAGRHVP